MGSEEYHEGTQWYLSRDGKRYGPYPFSVLVEAVRKNVITKADLVWRPGWETWRSSGSVPGLYAPPEAEKVAEGPHIAVRPLEVTQQKPEALTAPRVEATSAGKLQKDSQAPKRHNYFVRHWRGELSLPVSYWLNGLLAGLLAFALALILVVFTEANKSGSPALTSFALICFTVAISGLATWQFVGIWRSATKYQASGKAFWGGLAKLVVVLGIARTVYDLGTMYVPIISEHVQIALGDRKFGEHGFRLLRNGTELEFSGGINVGTAKEFEKMLKAAAQVRVIHLNSQGGRIAEADLIAGEVQKRRLITYVSDRCYSACTHVFLAGRERWIGERGRLGFHQPTLAGLPKEKIEFVLDEERKALIAKGLPTDFVSKVMATPNSSMWEPSHADLRAAKVITGIADSARFAASGQFATLATSDRLEELLTKIPLFATLKRVEPQTFEAMLAQVRVGYQEGAPEADIHANARNIFRQSVMRRLPHASDVRVIESIDIKMAYMSALRNSDAESCVGIEDDTRGAKVKVNLAVRFPAIATREQELYMNILESSRTTRTLPKEQQVAPTFTKVLDKLAKRSDLNANLLDKDKLSPAEYGAFCDYVIAFYQELRRLPAKEAADLARYLYAEAGK